MREARTSRARPAARLTAALVLGVAALLPGAGASHAAPADDPLQVDIPDYQRALDLVRSASVREAVCRFLSVPLPAGGSAAPPQAVPDRADPCEGMPAFTIRDPLAVSEITPGFVAGTAQPIAGEAVELRYLVSSLSVAVGNRQATVMLAPSEGGGWHLAAVREGDSDVTYAGKAGPGTLVFAEPQIRGWYHLKLLTVEPLNDQARQGFEGRASMSLGEYQKVVKARYADKLPGSEYDTKGMSSGYGTAARSGDTSSSASLLVGVPGAALGLAAGAFLIRRRRRGGTG